MFDWISDNVSGAFDWIGNQFASSGANSAVEATLESNKAGKSFWDDVFTGENILGAIQGGASILMADQNREQAQAAQAQQLQDQMALQNQQFEQEKALLALKAALGGGGGGGGPDPRRERYLARLDAMKARMNQRSTDVDQVRRAMESVATTTSARLLGG